MQLIKLFIVLILFLPFTAYLQEIIKSSEIKDSVYIQSRYIALRPTDTNSIIFDSDTLLPEEEDLIHVIEKLVANNKIDFYVSDYNCRSFTTWYKVNYYHRVPNYLFREMPIDYDKIYYFDSCIRPDVPLSNQHGEDSISIDGNFVYPWPKCRTYRTSDFDEIHIKEDLIYNDRTKEYSYQASGICFVFIDYQHMYKKFWIDLRELFSQLENKNQYSWYEALRNKQYHGFQYMQTSPYMNFKINNQ